MSRILPLVLAVLASTVLETRASDLRAEAESGALAVFERNLAAIAARDGAAYLACYLPSDRLVRNGFAGIGLGYDDLAASVGTAWPDRFEAFDLRVFALTGDVVYGQYRYRVQYGDDVSEGISERVFVRTDEGWRIAVTTAFEAPEGALAPPSATTKDEDGR